MTYAIVMESCATTSAPEEDVFARYERPGWNRVALVDACTESFQSPEIGSLRLVLSTTACISTSGGLTHISLSRVISVVLVENP